MTKKEKRQYRKSLGLCSECDNPAIEGGKLCQVHRDKNREYNRRFRERKKAGGLCVKCQNPALPGRKKCRLHLKRHLHLVTQAEESRRASGFCPRCGKSANGGTLCDECLQERREYDKKRYSEARGEIVSLLGSKCAVCGESDPELLEIDHVCRDGRKEREMFGNGRYMYDQMLIRIKNGLVDRYQLLCTRHHWEKTKQDRRSVVQPCMVA